MNRRMAGAGGIRRNIRGTHQAPSGDAPDTPLTLLGAKLKVWHRADLGLAANVSQWDDQSGNGHHVTQGTAAARPVLVPGFLDGQPALQFVSSDSMTLIDGLTGIAIGDMPSIFAVASFTDAGSDQSSGALVELTDSGIGGVNRCINIIHVTGDVRCRYFLGAVPTQSEALFNDSSVATPKLYEARVANGNAGQLAINGSTVATAGSTAAGGLLRAPNDLIYGVGFDAFEGHLCELLVVNPAPDAGERTALLAYFAARYPSLGL